MTYIMVDVEADGPIPGDYSMVCFGAKVETTLPTCHCTGALADPHYSDQTRFFITIDNHRDLLSDAELAQPESLLCCSLRQEACEY